jgi:2-keto-3-deoxy-L-rhamnonate aldolase RhmA
MSNWTSPVKQKFREGRPVVAATVLVPNADLAAHLAATGFDFLWVEMEHSPITLESLRNIVLATRGMNTQIFARVPINELWTAKRVLDQGVSGVIFPFTSTPELATQAAAACHYPPQGLRGSGATLAEFCWPCQTGYHDSADECVTVIAVIEESRAVDRIDEIPATPGIDALFIGTSDLSYSLGLRGDQSDPRLHDAIAKVLDAGRRHSKVVGRPCWQPDRVKEYVSQGFGLFQAPPDLVLLTNAAKDFLGKL